MSDEHLTRRQLREELAAMRRLVRSVAQALEDLRATGQEGEGAADFVDDYVYIRTGRSL